MSETLPAAKPTAGNYFEQIVQESMAELPHFLEQVLNEGLDQQPPLEKTPNSLPVEGNPWFVASTWIEIDPFESSR